MHMFVVIKIGTPQKKKPWSHLQRLQAYGERETASGIGHAEPSPALYAHVMLDDRVNGKYSDAVRKSRPRRARLDSTSI